MTDDQAFSIARSALIQMQTEAPALEFALPPIWDRVSNAAEIDDGQRKRVYRRLVRRGLVRRAGQPSVRDDDGQEFAQQFRFNGSLSENSGGTSITVLHTVRDTRVNCYSVLLSMTMADYLNLVEPPYFDRGGIEGQRGALKTSSAIRIRKRLVADLGRGAVLPATVIGIVLEEDQLTRVPQLDNAAFQSLLDSVPDTNISIIDGMQRTTAMLELRNELDIQILQRITRVELWLTTETNSLIYRMLVLNTGQVPWDLKRQIEVIHRPLLREITNQVPRAEVMYTDDERRRARPGQFQASRLIELYMVFGTRKEKINIPEKLAEEFTRLDFIEATAEPAFTEDYCKILRLLMELDFALARAVTQTVEGRFKNGMDIFSSISVCVGFVAAAAIEIFGRPGGDKTSEQRNEAINRIITEGNEFVGRLNQLSTDNLIRFIDFPTLNETFEGRRAGPRIAEIEREFFLNGFRVLLAEHFAVESLTPCWRA